MIKFRPVMPERTTSPNISSISIFRTGEKAPNLSEEQIKELIYNYFRKKDPESGQSYWLRILRWILGARKNLAQLQSKREGALEHGPGETSVEEINISTSRLASGELYFRIRGNTVIPEISARPEDVTLNPGEVMVKVQLDQERFEVWLKRLAQQELIR